MCSDNSRDRVATALFCAKSQANSHTTPQSSRRLAAFTHSSLIVALLLLWWMRLLFMWIARHKYIRRSRHTALMICHTHFIHTQQLQQQSNSARNRNRSTCSCVCVYGTVVAWCVCVRVFELGLFNEDENSARDSSYTLPRICASNANCWMPLVVRG